MRSRRELAFEPALGLEAVEEVAAVAGGGAAGAELGDERAEGGLGFGRERGFAGAGTEGDLLDAIEGFGGGADADASELEAVEEEGEFGAGAEALVDDGLCRGRDEGEDAGDGGGEALLRALGVRGMDEAGGEVALVVGVAAFEVFGALVELVELPCGGRAFEPGHAREGEGGGALGDDEFEAFDDAFGGGFAAELQPEDAEGEDAVDGGGRLVFVDGDDGPGFLAADEQAAGVGGPEAALEVHGGAEGVGGVVGEGAEEGALEDFEVTRAGLLAGGGGAAVAVAGDFEQGGFGLAEFEDGEAEGLVAEFGGDDAADEVALVAPEMEGAAVLFGGERVFGDAHVEESFAVFVDDGGGVVEEEGFEGGGDGLGWLRRDGWGGRHGDNFTAKACPAGRAP